MNDSIDSIQKLRSLIEEISRLSYGYICDGYCARASQRQYLRDLSALADFLSSIEEATQDDNATSEEDGNGGLSTQRDSIPQEWGDYIASLELLRSELLKPSPTIFGAIDEDILKTQINILQKFYQVLADFAVSEQLVATHTNRSGTSQLGHIDDVAELLDWIAGSDADFWAPLRTPYEFGKWFIDTEVYQNWLNARPSTHLLCYGPPGVGKSVLATLAYEHAVEVLPRSSNCVLRYFFDQPGVREVEEKQIVRSLLRQAVLQRQDNVIRSLLGIYEERTSQRMLDKDLLKSFTLLCHSTNVSVIFGGISISMCEWSWRDSNPTLVLGSLVPCSAHFLVFSEESKTMIKSFANDPSFEVRLTSEELGVYIRHKFKAHDLLNILETPPDLTDQIISKFGRL